jgi:TatD DNase family protein
MLTDAHSHKVNTGEVNTIYNLRINDDPMSLPHGPRLYFSVGIHPWDADRFQPSWLDKLNLLLNYRQVVAIGECGLDKNSNAPLKKQLEVVERQIILSEIAAKPLIIHCVGCYNEVLDLRGKHSPSQAWVIHGFRGKPALAQQLLKAGFYLSYGEKHNAESVALTPPDRLLLETDDSGSQLEDVAMAVLAAGNYSPVELSAPEKIFRIK